MRSITLAEFGKNMEFIMDQSCGHSEPIVIQCAGDRNVVLLPLTDYELLKNNISVP